MLMPIKLTTYYRSQDIPDLPGTNTFHSKELFSVYEKTKGYTPLLIVATENGICQGKILAAIRKKTTRFIMPTFAKKCEVYGNGEYFCPEEKVDELFGYILRHLTKEALRKSFLIQFRNLGNPLLGYKQFKENDYFAVNWLRVRNYLQEEGPLDYNFSPSRRRQIRRGLKNGAQIMEATTSKEVEEFAVMLSKIYSAHIRKHYPSVEFFHHINKSLLKSGSDMASVYIVKYKDKIIGGTAVAFSNKDAYLWFSGGMRTTYAKQNPGILAVWMALNDAKERGCEHLEFMDVGLPFRKHTYREFVLRFGGKQSSTRRWFRFRWKWLNRLFHKFYD